MNVAEFKVGDTVRVRKDAKLSWPSSVSRDEIGTVMSLDRDADALVSFPGIPRGWYVLLLDLELVSPAPPQPDPRDAEADELSKRPTLPRGGSSTARCDPRDAEIAALRQRVAELELRQDDDDWKYYRELVAAVIRRQDCPLGNVNAIAHDIFEEVKFREGGGDSAPERSRHENREKNLLVRGKSLLGG